MSRNNINAVKSQGSYGKENNMDGNMAQKNLNRDLDNDFEKGEKLVPLTEIHKNVSAPNPTSAIEESKTLLEKEADQPFKQTADPDDSYINKIVDKKIEKKYLVFRPYIDPMNMKPFLPPDRGYYYKMFN